MKKEFRIMSLVLFIVGMAFFVVAIITFPSNMFGDFSKSFASTLIGVGCHVASIIGTIKSQ